MISRFESDLKLLTKEQLTEKYGPYDWDEYIAKVDAGIKIAPLGPPTADMVGTEEETAEIELPAPPYCGRAFGRFVMIRRLEPEHSGRLVMPLRLAGTSDVGWVASTGIGPIRRFFHRLIGIGHVKPGNIVVFDQYASVGREVRLRDEEGLPGTFLLVEEPDILAVLEKV
jgi:co-chaperonin GroES (HSP10)